MADDDLSCFYSRHPTTRMYICQFFLHGGHEVCGHQSKSKFNLKVHLQSHFKIRPHRCLACNKWFTTKQNLNDHTLRHFNEKKFRCPVKDCGQRFYRKRDLMRHGKTQVHKDQNFD